MNNSNLKGILLNAGLTNSQTGHSVDIEAGVIIRLEPGREPLVLALEDAEALDELMAREAAAAEVAAWAGGTFLPADQER
jgi:hypothetical protein